MLAIGRLQQAGNDLTTHHESPFLINRATRCEFLWQCVHQLTYSQLPVHCSAPRCPRQLHKHGNWSTVNSFSLVHRSGHHSNSCSATGSSAAFAPSRPTAQTSRSPEPELQEGGGDGGAGGSGPPKTYGRGDGEDNWRDEFWWWWENHNPFEKLALGVRMRVAADPDFTFKLAAECCIDAVIIVSVNLLARREKFFTELEFTLSQIAVSLLNDFALVYLLAPTPECSVLTRGTKVGMLRARLADLPAHVFQQSPGGILGGYTLGSRIACFAAKGVQYGLVGLIMGIAGSSFVLGLTTLRTNIDKGYKPPPTYQPIFGTGLGWLIFMSGNSNIRYNLINLVEDFSYDRFPGPKAKALSIFLRLCNNIFGAQAWMHMAKRMNLNRPRKLTRKWKAEVKEEPVTAMPAAH